MSFLLKNYISPQGVKALTKYNPQGADHSLTLRFVLRPFYNWFHANVCPLWIAPNLITLIGFAMLLLSHSIMLWYLPLLKGEAPRWVYLFAALALFSYQTLDNIDGKQARRTGTSSPLGELFDHGVDALATTVANLTAAAGFQAANRPLLLFVQLSLTYIPFYLATWEEYHVGGLYQGYITGPIEGILISITIFLVNWQFGTDWWQQPNSYLSDLTNYELLILFMVVSGSLTIVSNFYKCFTGSRDKNLLRILLRLVPFLIWYMCFTGIWFWGQSVHQTEPLIFVYGMGFAFARVTSRLTVAHVAHDDYPLFHWILVPLPVLAVAAYQLHFTGSSFLDLHLALRYYLLYSALLYSYFVWRVIAQMVSCLDICFLILPKSKRTRIVGRQKMKLAAEQAKKAS